MSETSMTSIPLGLVRQPATLALAQREQQAAMAGGRVWQEFVSECEETLEAPWSLIREAFNVIHKYGFAGR